MKLLVGAITFLLTLAAFIAALAPLWLIMGWIYMLVFGALGHIFNYPDLCIGYWHSVLVGFLLAVVFGGLMINNRD